MVKCLLLKMDKLYLLLAFTTTILFNSCSSEFPTSIKRCKVEDNKCLLKTINQLIQPAGKSGIPQIDLKSFEPLHVHKINIEQGVPGSAISVKIRIKDANFIGMNLMQFKKVSGFSKDPRKAKIEFLAECPLFVVDGTYKLSGSILVLPVNGQGKTNISLVNNDISMKFLTHVETRDNLDYLTIDKIEYKFTVTKMKLFFENLLNDKALSDNMNKFLNENQQLIFNEIEVAMSAAFADILKDLINPVFHKYPYRELFEDE